MLPSLRRRGARRFGGRGGSLFPPPETIPYPCSDKLPFLEYTPILESDHEDSKAQQEQLSFTVVLRCDLIEVNLTI